MARRKRSKAKLRTLSRNATLFALVLSLALLLTWPYLRTAFLRLAIPVGRGSMGTLEERIDGEAVFAGGVSLITAPVQGTVRYLVRDGESVRTGQAIAEVGKPDAWAALEDSLSFARAQLSKYESDTRQEFEYLSAQAEESYAKAVALFFLARETAALGDLGFLAAREAQLEAAEENLRSIARRLGEIEGKRSELAGRVAAIESLQSSSAIQVVSPTSGVFSSEVTSIEGKFTRENLDGKTAAELAILAREARETKPVAVMDGQTVEAGDFLGRVISGQGVAFYLPVKTEDKPALRQDGKVELVLSDGTTVQARVTGVYDGKPPGYSIIVGEISVMPVSAMRKVDTVGLVARTQSGVVIPKAALVEQDGRQGVLLVQKTYARFREVEVLMVKGDKAVVRGIAEADEIVLRGWGFLEGRRVR